MAIYNPFTTQAAIGKAHPDSRINRYISSESKTANETVAHKATYRYLLGEVSWQRLHCAIRGRFSQDQSANYQGHMKVVYLSFLGKILAQLCRLIGTPLAFYSGENIPTEVKVYRNEKIQGYTWERIYHFTEGVNRVVSTKCLRQSANEPLALSEYLGFGISMKLAAKEDNGDICFTSQGYEWQYKKVRFNLPQWLHPGLTTVRQHAFNSKEFFFELSVKHPWFGLIAYQYGEFASTNML